MGSKTPLLLFLGAALFIVLISCTGPTFNRPLHDPVMSNEEMHAELVRLDQVNLNVGSEDFDPSKYPVFVGFDFRNGRTLINKFICWDGCPERGKVFLLYEGVITEDDCLGTIGMPLIPPEPVQGEFWGCRPIINWSPAASSLSN